MRDVGWVSASSHMEAHSRNHLEFLPCATHCGQPRGFHKEKDSTEPLFSRGLDSGGNESYQTNVTKRMFALMVHLILRTHPQVVERDFGISDRIGLE